MRTLRTPITGTIVLALLGGLGGAAVAQEESAVDPMAPQRFTMDVVEVLHEDDFFAAWEDTPEFGRIAGVGAVTEVVATDPRISGTWAEVNTYHAFWEDHGSNEYFQPFSAAVRIDNDDGAWLGHSEGFWSPGMAVGQTVLEGQGAYEGLTAIIGRAGVPDEENPYAGTSEGVIFGGGMPSMPDPPEPTVE